MSQLTTEQLLKPIRDVFCISWGMIEEMRRQFHVEMAQGLAEEGESLKMLPAYIDRASGTERGTYIALDLGGTNFRVLEVTLDGGHGIAVERAHQFVIPAEIMRSTGERLFDFIAGCIREFLSGGGVAATKMDLGFTFSFPMRQTGIDRGTLVAWTKGFTASDVVGTDIVKQLEAAFERCGVNNLAVKALANDTVTTLATGSYADPRCDVGVIFGTGSNACYREDASRVSALAQTAYDEDHVIVNIEWGNFDKMPSNDYDERLHQAMPHPGTQRMEKMIAGMYLATIARLVMDDLIGGEQLFSPGAATFTEDNFRTEHMAAIESDTSSDLTAVANYLASVGITANNLRDRQVVQGICSIISHRAARLSAAALSSVVTWMDPGLDRDHTVAIDGSVFEKYPGFREAILDTLEEIHHEGAQRFNLVHAKDGSGVGAAIAAAIVAHR